MSSETHSLSRDRDDTYLYDANTTWQWRTRLREIVAYRSMLRNLVLRDLKARYKNSLLGVLWSLLNPLGLMLVFTVLFTVLNSSSENAVRQFPVFVLVGLLPWNFFNGALISGAISITGNASLIKKVYFPREIIPIGTLLSNLVNFLIGVSILVAFLYIYGLGLTIHALWVPVILFTQLIFTLGLVFLLSALAVFYRDVLMILEVVMTAWFFLTPVFYPFEFFGTSRTVLGITFNAAQIMRWLNPMASIIDAYRTVLWGNKDSIGPAAMYPPYLLRTFLTSLIILIIGYAIFIRTEHLFGEKL